MKSALLLASLATAQFGTIQIDWSGETSDGSSRPSILLDAVDVEQPEQQQEDDLYEDAWWREGFGEDDESSWFGASPTVRTVRPLAVKYPVGTMYVHSQTGARGVVIGWDERTRAPRQWIRNNAGQLGASMARLRAPHYSCLLYTSPSPRDRTRSRMPSSA